MMQKKGVQDVGRSLRMLDCDSDSDSDYVHYVMAWGECDQIGN